MKKADIGLIGLGVMGENLILNMEHHHFTVAVYNRTASKVDAFLAGRAMGKKIIGTHSLSKLVRTLKKPRRIMLMIKAGEAVDKFISKLLPLLEKGDIVIDGGNSNFHDTIRRAAQLEEKGFLYIGTGVSGGEEGALKGPSIMPGGSREAWRNVKSIFQAISAKANDGAPCCKWIGSDGAGHFVKMVHNGIEYGDMQLICEAYNILKQGMGLSAKELHSVFQQWNKGELNSYLIEITAEILSKTDTITGNPMVDVILDTAGQKGTGKWASMTALDSGVPAPTIAEAVFARCISALKEERIAAAKVLKVTLPSFRGSRTKFIETIRKALYASKICSYAQGFVLMSAAAKEYKWNLKFGEIALIWRAGCIIRAGFLSKINKAFTRDKKLANLMIDPYFRGILKKYIPSLRQVIGEAARLGIPVQSFGSALAYFDSYRSIRLPANLLQAQRDYFGAHTYERVDRKRGEFFHTDWLA